VTAVVDPFELRKHGSHNQKDHGNWARGGSADYPIGHVVHNPLTISTGDFRMESDPARRFTELWQRTYDGYDVVREAAWNVLDGQDPLFMHSINHGYEQSAWVRGDYTHADLETDVASAGRWVADGLRNAAPRKKPLYRGAGLSEFQVEKMKVGDELELGPSSTSSKKDIALGYAQANRAHAGVTYRVLYEFPVGTKALNLNEHSDWGEHHPEYIVAGKFRVKGIGRNAAAFGPPPDASRSPIAYAELLSEYDKQPHYTVYLEPVSQPGDSVTKRRRGSWLDDVFHAQHRPIAELVQKHADHDQSSHGNWARGTDGGYKPRWSPTMTRAEAELWARDSVYRKPLTHTSTNRAWDTVADHARDYGVTEEEAERSLNHASHGILRAGFEPGPSGVFGRGIYLGAEELELEGDGVKEPVSDRLRGFLNNGAFRFVQINNSGGPEITDRQAEEYRYGRDKSYAATHRVMVDIRNPLRIHMPITGTYAGEHTVKMALRNAGHDLDALDAKVETSFLAVDEMVRHFGYDSMIIEKPGPFEWDAGGDQVVVYDRKQVTVISDDDYRYVKHAGPGPHQNGSPQSVHGGGGGGSKRTPMDATEARRRIKRALPNAHVVLDQSSTVIPDEAWGGIVNGIERMAAEFPDVVSDVVLVRSGPEYATTKGTGEIVWTTVTPPSGGTKRGLGLLLNADDLTHESWEEVRSMLSDDGFKQANTLSMESLGATAESVVVHEWGHMVHARALKEATGQDYFTVDGIDTIRNDELWAEQAGHPLLPWDDQPRRRMSIHGMPAADWAYKIDNLRIPEKNPLSSYVRYTRAEAVAEAFSVRHGPEGTIGTVPSEMAAVMDEMEALARA
jgi:hypothetical protein